MNLDLTSLEKALNQLKYGFELYSGDASSNKDERARHHSQAGCVQEFEFTYELSIKMMRRFISLSGIVVADTQMVFAEVIREANKLDLLLGNVKVWDNYRKKRNITSHTYDEDKALEIIQIIPDFIADAEHLLAKLKEGVNRLKL